MSVSVPVAAAAAGMLVYHLVVVHLAAENVVVVVEAVHRIVGHTVAVVVHIPAVAHSSLAAAAGLALVPLLGSQSMGSHWHLVERHHMLAAVVDCNSLAVLSLVVHNSLVVVVRHIQVGRMQRHWG